MRCWKTRATWDMECSPRDVSPAHASSSRRSVKCPRKRGFQMQRLRKQGCRQKCRCRPRKRGHRRRFHPHHYLRLHRWKFQRHYALPMSSMGLGLGTSGLASTWSNCQQTSATSDDGTVSIVRTAAFVDGCVARASGGAHYVGIRAAKVSAPESVDRGANTKTRIGPGKPLQDHHRTVFPCYATARARAW